MKKLALVQNTTARRLGWALGLLAGLSAGQACAQIGTPTGTDLNPAAPRMVRPDTATVRKPTKKQRRAMAADDSLRRTERLFGLRVTRAEKAGLLAIIPSGGQIYNKKYWKLPIVYGMVGGLGYWVAYQQRYFQYFKFATGLATTRKPDGTVDKTIPQQITAATDEIQDDDLRAQIAQIAANNPASLTNYLVFYRRQRDLSILISGFGYALQILDAVVDAHLSEFDVSDNLSLQWQPGAIPVPGQAALAPGLVFTLRPRK